MSTKKTFRILAALMFAVCIIFALSSCDALSGVLVKKECQHTMTETAEKAATCEQEGNVQYFTCSTCNKVFLDKDGKTETTLDKTVVAKTNHTAGAEATCTEDQVCTVCNAVITEKLGHNAEGTVAHKDATCTEAGVVGGTYCTR